MAPKYQPIDHRTLKNLVEAGSVLHASAVADGGTWALVVRIGPFEKALTSRNSGTVRAFQKLDTLTKYLIDLGIHRYEVEASNFDPQQKKRRPDRANAMRRLRDDADINRQFVTTMDESWAQMKRGEGLPHEQVFARLEKKLVKKYGPNPNK